jgi:CheY-like chemotaxis protein
LDLSKVDEGSLHLEPTEGDVFKCLRAVASSFNSHAAQRHIDYRVHIPQTVLWTSFDRDKLEKLVYNLLSNAFKFSDDTSVITCGVNYKFHALNIEVSDSGKGIPKEELLLIFDRFYQIENSYVRDGEGSGIGLSIVKAFVDLMDGTITVSSELNKGTYFTVQLPIQEIKTGEFNAEIPQEEALKPLQKKTYTLNKKDKRDLPSVLLVEDNEDMRHFIREQLIDHYKFREAFNGEVGLSEAISNPPDLIITDLMMPKMDGMETLGKIREEKNKYGEMPILILTNLTSDIAIKEGFEREADGYLIKTELTPEQIIEETKRVLSM